VPVVLGIAGGVGLSLALSRLLASFLYEIAPTDPASLGAAAGVLLAAGIAASLVPALAGRTGGPGRPGRGLAGGMRNPNGWQG